MNTTPSSAPTPGGLVPPPGSFRGRMWKRQGDNFLVASGYTLFVLTALMLFLPLLVTALMAFDSRTYLGPLPPPSLSLQWFERFFHDPYLIDGLKTSLAVSGIAVSVSTAVGIGTALALQRGFPGRDALAAFFVSPLVVPPVVLGFALLLFLAGVGLSGEDAFYRLVLGHTILTVPYTIRATMAGFVGVDPRLREAAMSLGATESAAFWEVIFPMARTGIVAGAIFAFAVSIDDVAVSMFLSGATRYTLPVALVSNMRANFDLTIAAASLMLVGFTIVLIIVLDRFVGLHRVVSSGLRNN